MIDWLFNSWEATRQALMVEQVLVARKTLLSKYVLVAVHLLSKYVLVAVVHLRPVKWFCPLLVRRWLT